MVPFGLVLSLVPYDPLWYLWSPYAPIQSHMVLYNSIWSGTVAYGPIQPSMVQYGSLWSPLVLYGPVWLCMVPYDPLWSCMVFEILGSPIAPVSPAINQILADIESFAFLF